MAIHLPGMERRRGAGPGRRRAPGLPVFQRDPQHPGRTAAGVSARLDAAAAAGTLRDDGGSSPIPPKRCGAWSCDPMRRRRRRCACSRSSNADRQGPDPDRRGRSATRAVRRFRRTRRIAARDAARDAAGPNTWIVPASPAAPPGSPARARQHRRARHRASGRDRAVRTFGGAIVSTSANRAGMPAADSLRARSGRRRRRRWRAGRQNRRTRTPARSRDARTGAVLRV